ncbi:hypothetical protein [Motilibacter deserti]|uniref:Uncharacterized protein n=1 Tax=Motilibacter deserti TaxID=2714956 RepID=A0ABX0GVV8_9ACTN|nr:hypothetical protein [Motilibacter deserti]NHC13775.1 hypothetical protein [Motilibacter deserti]
MSAPEQKHTPPGPTVPSGDEGLREDSGQGLPPHGDLAEHLVARGESAGSPEGSGSVDPTAEQETGHS